MKGGTYHVFNYIKQSYAKICLVSGSHLEGQNKNLFIST